MAILVAVVSSVLTIALFEAAFRLVGVEAGTRWLGNDVYPANPDGYFSPCGEGRYCVTGDRERTHGCNAPAEDGRRLVLFIGDSFTYGAGVRPEDTYSTLLEFPGYQRRNCAQSGANVKLVRDQLARWERNRPALTIYGMVLNDFDRMRNDLVVELPGTGWTWEEARALDDYVAITMDFAAYLDARFGHDDPRRWLRHLRVARFAYQRWLLRDVDRATTAWYRAVFQPGAPTREPGFAAIGDMAARSDHFLVVLFPLFVRLAHYPFEATHREIREELRRRGIEVLDLLDVYRGMDESQLIVFPTDRHPNARAHRLAAGAIRTRLNALGWPET